ncbi:hypothetical protein D3C80_1382130 [compost metagenome]
MPARAAGGGEHLCRALVQQVLHELAALLQGDDDAHAEQRPPCVLAAPTEHLHGNDPLLGAAVGEQAQKPAFAAIVAVGGASGDGHGRGDPLVSDRAICLIVVAVVVAGAALEAVPVHTGFEPAAFLIRHPVLIHTPARAVRLDLGCFGAQVDDVGFRRAHGGTSKRRGR